MSAAPSRNEVTRQPVGVASLSWAWARRKLPISTTLKRGDYGSRCWAARPVGGGGEDVNSKIARGLKRPNAGSKPRRAAFPRPCRGLADRAWSGNWASSLQSVTREFIGDIGSCRLGDGDVIVAAGVAPP